MSSIFDPDLDPDRLFDPALTDEGSYDRDLVSGLVSVPLVLEATSDASSSEVANLRVLVRMGAASDASSTEDDVLRVAVSLGATSTAFSTEVATLRVLVSMQVDDLAVSSEIATLRVFVSMEADDLAVSSEVADLTVAGLESPSEVQRVGKKARPPIKFLVRDSTVTSISVHAEVVSLIHVTARVLP